MAGTQMNARCASRHPLSAGISTKIKSLTEPFAKLLFLNYRAGAGAGAELKSGSESEGEPEA